MYVDEVRIDYIFYLIFGYLGSNLMKEQCYIDEQFRNCFFDWVLNWVKLNIDENYECTSFFWYHIIKDVTDTESEAVEMFFNLSNKFFAQLDKV